MEYLTPAEVVLIHARLIQRVGGSGGVRDVGLLESAVARPRATFDRRELYPDIWHKVAALMHSLIKNHPFVDGNKRTALTAAAIFLELNDYRLLASNQVTAEFTLHAAAGKPLIGEIADWFKANCSKSE